MLRFWVFTFLTIAMLAASSPMPTVASDGQDDVFMDEGDNDFEKTPIPAQAPGGAQAEGVEASSAPADEAVSLPEPKPQVQEEETDLVAPVVPAKREKKSAAKTARPAKVAKSLPGKVRPVAANGKFVVTLEACPMLEQPVAGSQQMLVVKASRKIWVEVVDSEWVRAFNRAGHPGYVSRACVK